MRGNEEERSVQDLLHHGFQWVVAAGLPRGSGSGSVRPVVRRMAGRMRGASGVKEKCVRVRAPWSPQLAGAVGAGPAVRPYRDVGWVRSPSNKWRERTGYSRGETPRERPGARCPSHYAL